MGCDVEWGRASDFAEPEHAAAAGTVLCATGATDDHDDSANEGSGDSGATTTAAGPAHIAHGADKAAASAASAAPAGGGVGAAASGADGALVAPDPDFTTWTPETWGQLDFRSSYPLIPAFASVLSGHTMQWQFSFATSPASALRIHLSGTTCSMHGAPPFTPSSAIPCWGHDRLRALTLSARRKLNG
jgi:hypothetical protein